MRAYGTTRRVIFDWFVLHLFNDAASNVIRVDGNEGLMTAKYPVFTYFKPVSTYSVEGRDSSVGIATRYGLDSPEIASRWGRDFPYLSRLALEPTQPPIECVTGLFLGVKLPGRGVCHPPISGAKVKERVEL
jgi:hypothetical protein